MKKTSLPQLILHEADARNLAAFSTADFITLGAYKAISKALERLDDQGKIQRIIQGFYKVNRFNRLLNEPSPTNIAGLAEAIARHYGWHLLPTESTALNIIGLSTQVPAKYEYRSSGPYRTFDIGGTRLCFKHANNKMTGDYSYKTRVVIQACKALGSVQIDSDALKKMRQTLTPKEFAVLEKESATAPLYIYEAIKKMKTLDIDE